MYITENTQDGLQVPISMGTQIYPLKFSSAVVLKCGYDTNVLKQF